jgi:CHRD domain
LDVTRRLLLLAVLGCATEASEIRGVRVGLTEEAQVPRCQLAGQAPTASGTVAADPITRAVSVELRYHGFSASVTGVHLHAGARTETGGELAAFPLSDSPIRASVILEPAAFDAFLVELDAGRVYVDVHTASCPDGAMRAQVY